MLKVPDFEVLTEVLDRHFSELPMGSHAREDDAGTIYVYGENENLLVHMTADTWLQLLDTKEEETIHAT